MEKPITRTTFLHDIGLFVEKYLSFSVHCTEKESLSKCFLRGNRNIIPKDKCTRNGFVLV